MNLKDFKDKINDELLSDFGTVILTGTEQLLAFPERKDTYSNDWAEANGEDYDLATPKFKDKEVSLKMGILADNDQQFWDYHRRLFAHLKREGALKLFVFDHSREYDVFYKKSSDFKKVTKRLKNVTKILVKFELTFRVMNDF